MESADQKLNRVREALRREFKLSTETGGGLDPKTRIYSCYTRDIVPTEIQEACGLNHNQFLGALDALEEEGFIFWYSVTPTKERLDPALETLRVAFPLDFEKQGERVAWLSYNPAVRDILVNDKYILSHPDFNSENEMFFEYVFARPNSRISRDELVAAKITKSPNAIVDSLGFSGPLREVFFPGVSTKGVLFRNTLTESDLAASGVDRKAYEKQLAGLKVVVNSRK